MMDGQSASSRTATQVSTSKGKNTKADEKIQELLRQLNRKSVKIAKLKHNQIECNKKQTLQFAFLQEKINLKNNKIVKLKKKYLKKRQQLAIENEQLRNEIDDLKQKCSSVSKKLSELSSRDENANSSNLENRNKSVSYRIRAVIDEIEKKMIDSSPPSDAEIKASVLDILRSTNLENTTMRNLISMVGDKYSQFDLSNKREFIKSVTKAALSEN